MSVYRIQQIACYGE